MFNEQKDIIDDLLRQIKKILDEHNIEFWVECRTLLGAVREKGFLEWGYDIDFGAWQDKVTEGLKTSVARQLHNQGFHVEAFKTYIHTMIIRAANAKLNRLKFLRLAINIKQ